MKILALGCSFTKGSELADPDTTAWPSVLARRIGASVDNLSEYNGSNDMMFRKAMELDAQYDLIIVGWSEAHRMEIWLNDPVVSARRKHPIGPFSVNHNSAGNTLEWVKPFYAHHHNVGYLLRRWLCQAAALQDHFKFRGQRFVFFTAFGNEEALIASQDVVKSKIDPRFYLGWPGESMMSWTAGLPYGEYGHPLEQGHKITAERIYEHIRNLGWLP